MSNLLNVALLVLVGIALVYLLVKRNKEPKVKKIVVVDPEAQKLYSIQKKQTDEKKTLTMQEKIELSWQFLINIKNQVLNKFSKSDLETVQKIGTILNEYGMKYQHDIELEVSVKQELSKAKSITKPKEQESLSR